ncbi:hypothetical protein [Streptomyces mirabilis]|uniref:WXG100 family type VII secretion target n=1 Tax=Streptomyces mirabilis TaxID=68239 RepID=A0ABU3V5D5_9ACTN|nr:hypothetical protein [Streptomyces mirabilis]MCX5355741.1 hypothetical protein [Streptomyces mirabilis]MDU9001384.1 hypothetical protein [Streptomyces mirabilis]
MSTPPANGRLQESSTATYGQAISSLESARSQMTLIQGDVQQAKATLQAHYQGEDGRAYARVMDTWLNEVDRIKRTCEAMENQLGNSMQSSNSAQAGAHQAIVDGDGHLTAFGSDVENGTYNAMHGA